MPGRPADGRYGDNPFRLYKHNQFQVILKPAPLDVQQLYVQSLEAMGVDLAVHDLRFEEDNWEAPTLGAWGVGWQVMLDGMEISQFTYFQQAGGLELAPISCELTYGLERITMFLGLEKSIYDIRWVPDGVNYGQVRWQERVGALPRGGDRPAGLRVRPQVLAPVQSARRKRGRLGHRARRGHEAGARSGDRLRQGVPRKPRTAGIPAPAEGAGRTSGRGGGGDGGGPWIAHCNRKPASSCSRSVAPTRVSR